MKDIVIREAVLGDMSTLLEFEQAIIAAERPYAKYLDDDPISYYDIKALIQSDKAEVLVAEKEQEIIGSGYALIKPSVSHVKHDYHSHLGFMFVKPRHRGKGVIKRILDGLINWSKSQNVHHIRLEVYADNQAAIKAYEKRGFENRLIEMCLSIDE